MGKGWPAPLWRQGELSSGRLGPKNGEFALEFFERSLPFRRHRVPWIPVLEGTQGHRNVRARLVISPLLSGGDGCAKEMCCPAIEGPEPVADGTEHVGERFLRELFASGDLNAGHRIVGFQRLSETGYSRRFTHLKP